MLILSAINCQGGNITETPRIRIEDKEHIKILVCHLIYSLGCPLSKEQLMEITSYEQAVNYFDLVEALDTIGERLCIVTERDGTIFYANTALGIKAAKELSNELPVSVREKMFDEAVRIYTRDAMKQNAMLSVRYAQSPNGCCTMGISIKDENTGRQKYYLNIYTDTSEQAENIKSKIKSNPEKLREHLDNFFK